MGIVLLTNPFLIRVAYRCWEVNPVEISSLDKIPYDGAIVLGGFGKENVKFGDRFEFGESANRLTQALELYHTGKVDRIIITGGSAAILTKKRSEGAAVERFLDRLKFPKEGLLVEGASRNSYENAIMTAKLLKEKGADQEAFLLCTDGWHMRRAVACFEKAGLKVIPFSTSGERPLQIVCWSRICAVLSGGPSWRRKWWASLCIGFPGRLNSPDF
ncbi:YdcF family protein [Akkermansiaceae bacterium]|nr:YdcF family protein [Akkermansiaceae bacterium]